MNTVSSVGSVAERSDTVKPWRSGRVDDPREDALVWRTPSRTTLSEALDRRRVRDLVAQHGGKLVEVAVGGDRDHRVDAHRLLERRRGVEREQATVVDDREPVAELVGPPCSAW